MSVGVRGLRVGTGPRGHYINVGTGGVYYRASVGRAGQKTRPIQGQDFIPNQPRPSAHSDATGVDMIEIESGDVLGMRDEQFAEVLDEVNKRKRKPRLSIVLVIAAFVLALLTLWIAGNDGWLTFTLVIPAYLLGIWLDSYRRAVVLFYELDMHLQNAYEQLVGNFDVLVACAGKWHVAAGGEILDLTTWKRNAGASRLVDKKSTELVYKLPTVIKSNVTPPSIQVGKQTIYFFPDLALVEDRGRFGAVGYANLEVEWEDSPFIEDGKVPRDARVIGYTWLHPNKSGGPDRRFRDNRQIPVCLYETMLIHCSSGVNEAVQFSRTGVVQPLSQSLKVLPRQSVAESSRTK